MPLKYETNRLDLMREILRCAYQDREAMLGSLIGNRRRNPAGAVTDPEDAESKAECESTMRDIMRMDQNLGTGIFHPDAVKRELAEWRDNCAAGH